MKIIVADDSSGIRARLRRYLEELGHTVVGEARTGTEAVELYCKFKPDLLTLDIVMPEMDGLSALRQIMKVSKMAKVVMITSAATVSNMFEAKEIGAIQFMAKPFQKTDVQKMLTEVENRLKNGEAA